MLIAIRAGIVFAYMTAAGHRNQGRGQHVTPTIYGQNDYLRGWNIDGMDIDWLWRSHQRKKFWRSDSCTRPQ